jgi:S1-C subfamily serine protease
LLQIRNYHLKFRAAQPCSLVVRHIFLSLLLIAGCARLPVGEARDTPVARVAAESFAQLHDGLAPLSSAVAIGKGLLATNAHVLRGAFAPGTTLGFTRGDGAVSGHARLLAVSPRMDLALFSVPQGALQPASLAEALPEAGQPVWAAGAPSAGPAVAAGLIERPATTLPGSGPGFTARIGALMGYSGGPVVDGEGRVLGLVTALPRPGAAAPVMALLTGLDLDGLVRAEARDVFVLSITAAREEAGRLLARQ